MADKKPRNSAELELDHELPPAEDDDAPQSCISAEWRNSGGNRIGAGESQGGARGLSRSRGAHSGRVRELSQAQRKRAAGISRLRAGRRAQVAAADSRQPGPRAEDQGGLAGRFSLGHRAHRQAVSRCAGQAGRAADGGGRRSRSIPICIRRCRWSTPTRSRTITCSTSCSAATS